MRAEALTHSFSFAASDGRDVFARRRFGFPPGQIFGSDARRIATCLE